MNQLLSLVTDSGTAKCVTLDEILDTAGKTGTSADDRDRLFIGYTPYYTAGIWCGYTDGKTSINVARGTHLKIWDEIMKEIHETTLGVGEVYDGFSTEGLRYLSYCKDSGHMPGEACGLDLRGERVGYGYFEPSNCPTHKCQCHVICYIDEETGELIMSFSEDKNLRKISLISVKRRKNMAEIKTSDSKYVLENWINMENRERFDSYLPSFDIEKKRRKV